MSLRLEQRGGVQVLICSCCNLPYAKVQFGRLVIQSKHYTEAHTNALTIEELKSLVAELEKSDRMTKVQHRVPA